jgi:hypothetical protein
LAKDWELKPHIPIPEDGLRREPKKSRLPPLIKNEASKKDHAESGKSLIKQFDDSIGYCKRPQKVIKEDPFFVLNTEKPIGLETELLDRFGFNLSLQLDEQSAIVTLPSDLAVKFRNFLLTYEESGKLRSYLKQVKSISRVISPQISPEVENWLERSDSPMYIELELLPNLGEENYAQIIRQLLEFLKSENEQIIGERIREQSASIRACLKPQTVKRINQGLDSLWETRRAPRIIVAKPQRITLDKNHIPQPKPPEQNAKCVCVIDTGIDLKHPMLDGVCLDAVDLTADGSPQDTEGHGTFVSGLAAYGELENRSRPEASAYLISVKVLGNDQYPYLETYLEQAAQRFSKNSRIFNLSVMYDQNSNFSRPTNLAHTIDTLSREHNILFVLPTGNIGDELPSLLALQPYPTYFGDRKCLLFAGAEASSNVTVGGVASKESDQSLAKNGQPSPFTRRGDFNHRAKPDVVANAGNMERDSRTGILQGNDEVSVISLGLSPDYFAFDIGTSFSAPVVANLLAKLSKEYPEAGPNLLKALLIHFARWPINNYRLNAGENLKKSLFGKGMPDFYRCAFSTRSCATYFLEDTISFTENLWVPIYIPRIMKKICGDKLVRVTLVYDPPVDRSVSGYTCVDLDFQLFKELKKQNAWDHSFRRKWDNVKTDIFRWQKSGWGKEWSILIQPQTRFKDRLAEQAETGQRFALVVSLEDPNQKIDVYNAIFNERKRMVQTLLPIAQRVKRGNVYKKNAAF